MTTYNTGNALGSSDARDLYDNAENIDNFANGSANTFNDRFSVSRKSIAGMENAFDTFIQSSGYTVPVAYTSGIVLSAYNQLIEYDDEFYKLKAGQAPYTTTGTWGTDSAKLVSVGDAALRQELTANANDFNLLPEIANYAALQAYTGDVTAYYVRGVANIFDGGAGVFRVDTSDITTADNGGTVLVDAAGRRWKREFSGSVNPRWFGAKADGVTDDTAALEDAEVFCRSAGLLLEAIGGTYLITRRLDFRAPFIDLSRTTVLIGDDFPDDVAINYETPNALMSEQSFVSVNINGNRYNQTSEVIAFQVSKAVSARSEFRVIGHRCNTLVEVIGNVERCLFHIFATVTNKVLVEDRDPIVDSPPDTNTYFLSAGHCNQFFVKKGSTTSFVHFNCQGQYNVLEDGTLSPSTVYPVEILEGRISTLAGEIRATTFGAILIDSATVQTFHGLHFDELSLQGIYGATPAIYNKAYNSISGNVTLIAYGNKAFVSETLNSANLAISLLNSDYVGDHLEFGSHVLSKATNGKFDVVARGLAAGSVVAKFRRVGSVQMDITGSAFPVVVDNTVSNDQVTLTVSRDYVINNVSITTNGIRVDCSVEGLLNQVQILAYSSPFRGLKCWNLNTNSVAFYNGSAWYAPTANLLS